MIVDSYRAPNLAEEQEYFVECMMGPSDAETLRAARRRHPTFSDYMALRAYMHPGLYIDARGDWARGRNDWNVEQIALHRHTTEEFALKIARDAENAAVNESDFTSEV